MEEAQSARESLEAFLSACGVTVRLEETPQDRFAEAEAGEAAPTSTAQTSTAPTSTAPAVGRAPAPRPDAARPPPVSAPEGLAPAAAPADEAPVFAAREAARSAATLEALRDALASFEGCPLKATARSTCSGEGPVGAPLMLVGEAPGRDEDEAGRPFVGPSGKLLEKMLAAIGFARGDVFISNVIPWRPVGNRTPSPVETATCEVFVRREIALVGPKVLVLLGGAAAKTLLRTDISVTRQHGRLWPFKPDDAAGEGEEIDAVPTFHPAYLLRTPADKAKAWRDLLVIRRRLEEVHGLPPLG
jgi:DNA polymerase